MAISSIEIGLIGCIESTLNAAVHELIRKGSDSNREWTHDCLKAIATLGIDIGYGVCPYPENMSGEWLYDLIWYTEEKSDWPNRMTDVVLVLESEWSQKLWDIRYDFQKLVQAKSHLKMLICSDLTGEMIKSLVADIEVFKAKDESEIYILASYDSCKKAFNYGTYQVGGAGNGELFKMFSEACQSKEVANV